MFKQLLNEVQDKYKKIQEDNARYQDLLNKVFVLPKFYPYTAVDKKNLTVSHKLLIDMCPDLNEKDAILIRGLIPIEEVCLSCLYAIECKTGIKFYFVATTKYLWLVNAEGYLKYQYQDFAVERVKNGLLSKILLMGNMLFNINGIDDVTSVFEKLIMDKAYREDLITKKLAMFCGTVPRIFYMNDIASGISIGGHHEIVFHTREFHYKYNISDIKNYELLLDDMVIREKKSNRRSRLTANKSGCYEMVLRVTTSDREFLVPIIEKNAFITLYSSTSVVFMENKAFADKLVDLLDDLDEARLNGEL